MGYISTKGIEFAYIPHMNKFCTLGLYCTDTDIVECFLLDERKRKLMNIDLVEIVKDAKQIASLTALYINSDTSD
jgi:hypothetical protein